MADEFFTRTPPPSALPRKPAGSGRLVIGVALLSFLLGAALVGWFAFNGQLQIARDADSPAPARVAASPVAAPPAKATPTAAAPTTDIVPLAATAGLEQRLAQAEQRLNALDLRAQAATGNAARAEGLLIALAARRALERGMPLGALEDQLRLRFGDAQPNAVRLIIEAARQPVTLDRLDAGLEGQAARMRSAAHDESGWDRFARQLSGMLVIRRSVSTATQPAERLAQAQVLLRGGQVEAAANLVAGLPGARAASGWIAEARRYASAQQALDQIETAAILEPRDLQDGAGRRIEQPSPAALPPPTGTIEPI